MKTDVLKFIKISLSLEELHMFWEMSHVSIKVDVVIKTAFQIYVPHLGPFPGQAPGMVSFWLVLCSRSSVFPGCGVLRG